MKIIPVIDLAEQYRFINSEIDAAVSRALAKGSFILGEEVSSFEQEFSSYCGTAYGIGVASGTDALLLALKACDIGSGDEVITSAHTATATVMAIVLSGALPVLIDADLLSMTLDPDLTNSKISPRTRAIIPVHMYGYPAEPGPILEIAKQNKLFVIEDCAQAHGALYKNKKVGGWGDLAAFSFYPTKNLGAYGDAGMVLTNNTDLAEKLFLLRQYGWKRKYVSEIKGMNSRLDNLQAAICKS